MDQLQADLSLLQGQAWEEYRRLERRYELQVFLLRLAYALPLFLGTVVAWWKVGARRNVLAVILTSFAGFGALQLVVLVFQYAWTLFREAAQLAVSIGGSAIAIAGLVTVRRFLLRTDRQIRSRLRHGLCPGCGFPLAEGHYCPGCGRRIRHDCPHCGARTLAQADHCTACGRSLHQERGAGEERDLAEIHIGHS